MTARTLVIKVTAGKDDPERCGQALTVAATALASGVAVSLWLAAEAAWLAVPGGADDIVLPHSPPLGDLLASIVAGGTVTLCTQCAARRDIGPGDVIEGIRIGGAPPPPTLVGAIARAVGSTRVVGDGPSEDTPAPSLARAPGGPAAGRPARRGDLITAWVC